MLKRLKDELAQCLSERVKSLWGISAASLPEIPPRRELGDLAFPIALQLARELKRSPRAIAEEVAEGLELPDWVLEVRVEGPGFLNLFLDRSRIAASLLENGVLQPLDGELAKTIVEHTNINPNKAAHIGHLRNAVLGDVLAKTLRRLGHPVEIQNYIDDTGVQLADVVVGLMDLRGLDLEAVEGIPEPFDYHCWDLYSEVRRWLDHDPDRQELRRLTLHELEAGSGLRADIGQVVVRRILRCHLATMRRLGIRYDLLTHENAILKLAFFDNAFANLESSGAIHFEKEGKNAGCWVMPLAGSAEFAGLEDPDKIIVRSDGTVTYVGKDIAYQLWKLGLLGLDFHYRYWEEEKVWQTVVENGPEHPTFGSAARVVNVIDARQSYLQKIVRAGVEKIGYAAEAERSIHFAYEMVTLSAAAAEQLGVSNDGDEAKSVEMSGRKGIGVKADDLLDQLESKSRQEITSRNRELQGQELDQLASQIATAALRFLMTKATTTRIIAFDFDEALNFEGESGPYLLYSLVRVKNIRKKLAAAGRETETSAAATQTLAADLWSDDLWDLVLTVAQLQERVEVAASTLELSLLARTALELAQGFNAVYHRHPILHEDDAGLRAVRLATTQIFELGLEALTDLLGMPIPDRM
ncbi:MAG: arginine--tRNA ligase [Acidobacteriota bacterium]|nr:arginine--tRNA ligase [Acidobacteriota bacterium]